MNTLVIAPHPDDEVLGVGGTLLRRKSEGSKVGWLIMTQMSTESGWSESDILKRRSEIDQIKQLFKFDFVYELPYGPSTLDQTPRTALIDEVKNVLNNFGAEEIFVPHFSDVHSDHRVTFEVLASCVKRFRYSDVRRLLAYETASETGFGLSERVSFEPNYYVNIEKYLDQKIEALKIYSSEIGNFPFPRSVDNILSLAKWRGSFSGFVAAEAFQLLKEYE